MWAEGVVGGSPEGQPPAPVFLAVRPGDFVIVAKACSAVSSGETDWWMGQVVFCEGGARDPKVNSLFQIADVDDGCIHWVNADQVTHVLHGMDGLIA